MRFLLPIFLAFFASPATPAQTTISLLTEDGATVFADLYGKSERAIVFVHGGRFTKESWAPQARALQGAGYQVLAVDLRGFGKSHGPGDSDLFTAPHYLDVLAAVRYLHQNGAKVVSAIGGSMGGAAAGDASIASRAGEIDRVVFLGASPNGPAEKLKSASLYIVARDDANDDGPRLPGIRAQFEKSPEPKELIILEGSAHAQFLFQTDQADRVMREILRFLSQKLPR